MTAKLSLISNRPKCCKKHQVPLRLRECSNDFLYSRRRWICPICQDKRIERDHRRAFGGAILENVS